MLVLWKQMAVTSNSTPKSSCSCTDTHKKTHLLWVLQLRDISSHLPFSYYPPKQPRSKRIKINDWNNRQIFGCCCGSVILTGKTYILSNKGNKYFPSLYVFQNLNILIQYWQISQQVSRWSFDEKRGSHK